MAQKYEAQQKQNYCERQEKRYDRISKYSLDEDNQRIYGARAKAFGEKAEQFGRLANSFKTPVEKSGKSGIINTRDTRNMANGMRTPPTHILNEQEIESIKSDIKTIGADEKVFRFNSGRYTGYNDDGDFINIRGDILPDKNSKHPRDVMSQRAVIAHEYYGHRVHRGTKLPKGSWNDEFRASYSAAKNCPNLSDEDRCYLVLDALERAKEKGVAIKYNKFIRRVLYGY